MYDLSIGELFPNPFLLSTRSTDHSPAENSLAIMAFEEFVEEVEMNKTDVIHPPYDGENGLLLVSPSSLFVISLQGRTSHKTFTTLCLLLVLQIDSCELVKES